MRLVRAASSTAARTRGALAFGIPSLPPTTGGRTFALRVGGGKPGRPQGKPGGMRGKPPSRGGRGRGRGGGGRGGGRGGGGRGRGGGAGRGGGGRGGGAPLRGGHSPNYRGNAPFRGGRGRGRGRGGWAPSGPRTNQRITSATGKVRLVGQDGEQIGVVPLRSALNQARAAGLDLVEMSAAADPPVVRMLDQKKAEYDARKQAKKQAPRQEAKELRFQVGIAEGDLNVKLKRMRQFLEKGDTVTATVLTLRGRNGPDHREGQFMAHRLLQHCEKELEEVGIMARTAMRGIRLKGRWDPRARKEHGVVKEAKPELQGKAKRQAEKAKAALRLQLGDDYVSSGEEEEEEEEEDDDDFVFTSDSEDDESGVGEEEEEEEPFVPISQR